MSGFEVVGSIASVVQLAQVVYSISKQLYEVGNALANASSDITDLAHDLEIFSEELLLHATLVNTEQSQYSDQVNMLTAKIIGRCATICVRIDRILKKLRKGGVWAKLKWLYKEKELKKLLDRLRDLKLSLMGTLSHLRSLKADYMMDAMGVAKPSLLKREDDEEMSKETMDNIEETRRKLAEVSVRQKKIESSIDHQTASFQSRAISCGSSKIANLDDLLRSQRSRSDFSSQDTSSTPLSSIFLVSPEASKADSNPFISAITFPGINQVLQNPSALESVQSFFSALSYQTDNNEEICKEIFPSQVSIESNKSRTLQAGDLMAAMVELAIKHCSMSPEEAKAWVSSIPNPIMGQINAAKATPQEQRPPHFESLLDQYDTPYMSSEQESDVPGFGGLHVESDIPAFTSDAFILHPPYSGKQSSTAQHDKASVHPNQYATSPRADQSKECTTVPIACVQCRSKHIRYDGLSHCARCSSNSFKRVDMRSRQAFFSPQGYGRRGSGDSYGFPTTNSTSCSISSTSNYPFHFNGSVEISPSLKPMEVSLQPSPSPPHAHIRLDSGSGSLDIKGSSPTKTKYRPKQGDVVLVSFMAGGKHSDIVRNTGDKPLASADKEAVDAVRGTEVDAGEVSAALSPVMELTKYEDNNSSQSQPQPQVKNDNSWLEERQPTTKFMSRACYSREQLSEGGRWGSETMETEHVEVKIGKFEPGEEPPVEEMVAKTWVSKTKKAKYLEAQSLLTEEEPTYVSVGNGRMAIATDIPIVSKMTLGGMPVEEKLVEKRELTGEGVQVLEKIPPLEEADPVQDFSLPMQRMDSVVSANKPYGPPSRRLKRKGKKEGRRSQVVPSKPLPPAHSPSQDHFFAPHYSHFYHNFNLPRYIHTDGLYNHNYQFTSALSRNDFGAQSPNVKFGTATQMHENPEFPSEDQLGQLWWRAFSQIVDEDSALCKSLQSAWQYPIAEKSLSDTTSDEDIARREVERLQDLLEHTISHVKPTEKLGSSPALESSRRILEILNVVQTTVGFSVGAFAWGCISTAVRTLLVDKSSDEIEEQHFLLAALADVATLVARYGVMENIYRNWPEMSLGSDYESSLVSLCIHVLTFLGKVLGSHNSIDNFQTLSGEMIKINEADAICREFKVTVIQEISDDSDEDFDSDGTLDAAEASEGRKLSVEKADTGTYSCTYYGCTLSFDTPAKLQQHKRWGHRNSLSASKMAGGEELYGTKRRKGADEVSADESDLESEEVGAGQNKPSIEGFRDSKRVKV